MHLALWAKLLNCNQSLHKIAAQQIKKKSPYRIQKNSTKDRNLYRIFRVRDVEMISISQNIARYVAMFFFCEAVKSCNSTRTCFSAPQLWGCAKVHGCLPLVPWQRCRGKFAKTKKRKKHVFIKNETYLIVFVLRTWIIVNSTSRIVPMCRVVNLAKSSAIRHMCSLQLGRIGRSF